MSARAVTPVRAGRALLLLAAALALPAHADEHAFRLSADGSASYDSNIGNGPTRHDEHATGVYGAGVTADYHWQLAPDTTLLLRGNARGEAVQSWHELSNEKGTGTVRLVHRFGDDFFAPTVAVWGSAAYWNFGSRIRDSNEYRGGVFLREPLSTEVDARLSATLTRRDSEGRVFDLWGRSVALDLGWMLLRHGTLYGAYQFYEGDETATGAPSFKIVSHARALEADDAFGGFGTGNFAYKLDGHTHVGTLGFNQGFSPTLALDLQGQYIATDAVGDNQYRRWLGTATLLMRF